MIHERDIANAVKFWKNSLPIPKSASRCQQVAIGDHGEHISIQFSKSGNDTPLPRGTSAGSGRLPGFTPIPADLNSALPFRAIICRTDQNMPGVLVVDPDGSCIGLVNLCPGFSSVLRKIGPPPVAA